MLGIVFASSHLMAQTSVEVAHWWTSKGEAKAASALKDAFEQAGYQWNDSSIVGGGGSQLMERLEARIAIGNPPTAVQMYMGPNVWKWGEEGVLANLNDVAEAGNWKDLLPPLINSMIQYEGMYVAVPINAHRVNWMWANVDVFRQAAVEPPTTWEDFLTIAPQIRKAGFIPLALGGQPWQEATLWETVLLDVGGPDFHQIAIQEQDISALKSPTMIKVFEMMRRRREFTDQDAPGRAWDATTEMVMEGQAAIQIMGDWAKGEFLAAGKHPEEDFLCLPAPGTEGIFLVDTDTFAMFKLQDNEAQEAQNAFARTVMSIAVQEQFNVYKGSIPARLDISPEKFDLCGQKSMNTFTQGKILPAFSYYQATSPDVQEAIVELISTHFHSNMTAEDAARKLAATVMAAC